jgi:hypothetical protein
LSGVGRISEANFSCIVKDCAKKGDFSIGSYMSGIWRCDSLSKTKPFCSFVHSPADIFGYVDRLYVLKLDRWSIKDLIEEVSFNFIVTLSSVTFSWDDISKVTIIGITKS